ncbi:glycosyl hydrolase family 18 protein [Pseudochelatococcus sp. B33]
MTRWVCGVAWLLVAGLPAVAGERAEARPPFLAYHASWYERPAATAGETTLAHIPGFVDIVALAFARPDLDYAGDLDLSGTGLEYRYSGAVLKEAVRLLKERNPGTRVVVSVGGAGWGRGWHRFDEHALARLVRDLGADGVDLDFEPEDPQCAAGGEGRIVCASCASWIDYIGRVRAVMPRPLLLTVPAWSVGAYGEGRFAADGPRSQWTGSMLGVLRSSAAREIDIVSIMAYDAGPLYDPDRAFAAYRAVWKGPLLQGIAVRPADPGSPAPTPGDVARRMAVVREDPQGGAMLYALRLCPPEEACPPDADDRALARVLCRTMQREGCDAPIP